MVEKEVFKMVQEYFKEHLPEEYELLQVKKKSNHPKDFLWMVSAYNKKNDSYSFWSCFNTSTNSMNHGHYNIKSLSDVDDLFEEFYYDYRKGE